jgi:hypothetical protein
VIIHLIQIWKNLSCVWTLFSDNKILPPFLKYCQFFYLKLVFYWKTIWNWLCGHSHNFLHVLFFVFLFHNIRVEVFSLNQNTTFNEFFLHVLFLCFCFTILELKFFLWTRIQLSLNFLGACNFWAPKLGWAESEHSAHNSTFIWPLSKLQEFRCSFFNNVQLQHVTLLYSLADILL